VNRCKCGCGLAPKSRRKYALDHQPNKSRPVIERLLMRVDKSDNGCWLWRGQLNSRGYGQIRAHEKTCLAHRIAYAYLVGPIPEGLQLDHLCRVKRCVNPQHLEPVTGSVNLARAYSAAPRQPATTCRRGHEFTAANTYLSKKGRICRRCRRDWERAKRAAA
jgi:hypothetical protein